MTGPETSSQLTNDLKNEKEEFISMEMLIGGVNERIPDTKPLNYLFVCRSGHWSGSPGHRPAYCGDRPLLQETQEEEESLGQLS